MYEILYAWRFCVSSSMYLDNMNSFILNTKMLRLIIPQNKIRIYNMDIRSARVDIRFEPEDLIV